jgi:hypothetical protein
LVLEPALVLVSEQELALVPVSEQELARVSAQGLELVLVLEPASVSGLVSAQALA